MQSKFWFLPWIIGLLSYQSLSAQVTIDGTLGKSGALPGPNYQIGAELGSQHGPNLFHSFRDFNLQSHESATFNGPNNVQNIISRVTGGNPSSIDGTLRTTIPNADLYLLNPAGVMFGKNAKLDLQGGLHVSTADTLRLGEDGQFNAKQPSQSLLTVAPPTAFGFLTQSPAAITTHDSKLAVPEGKSLSFISGELQFKGSNSSRLDANNNVVFDAELSAKFGRINLASVASPGEVKLANNGLEISQTAQLGKILALNTNIITTGKGGGSIFIRAGQLILSYSVAESKTLGDNNGGVVEVQSNSLELHASKFSTSARAKGTGGSILITVNGEFTIWGVRPNQLGSAIFSRSHANDGNAGNISIQARQLTVLDGGQIATSTEGPGQGGAILIKVSGPLTLSGADALGYPSRITADTWSENNSAGPGGTINIEAPQINLFHGGQISASTHGPGEGGSLSITSQTLTISGIGVESLPNPFPDSPPAVFAKSSGVYSQSFSANQGAGDAGNLSIKANHLRLTEDGQIATDTASAGGGNITLRIPDWLYLHSGKISTSVKGGKGDGGNIIIDQPTFMVLNKAKLLANAEKGKGGNILLVAKEFLKSFDSEVSASSKLGIDGLVVIRAPTEDISGTLQLLSSNLLKVEFKPENPCGTKSLEEIEHPRFKFYVFPLAGSRLMADDWRPSPPTLAQHGKSTSPARHQKDPPPLANRQSPTTNSNPKEKPKYQPVLVMMECPKEKKAKSEGKKEMIPEQLF